MSSRIFFFIVFFLGYMSLLAQDRPMTAAEIASFEKVLKQTAKVKTLQADFTQYKKLGFVDKEIVSNGKVYVIHPDKMSWAYSSPTNYSIIFKNNKIYTNDRGKKNTIDVGNNKQFEKISKLIANGFSGELASSKDYTVSYYHSTTHYLIHVKPKAKEVQQYIQQINLSFDKKDNQISAIKLLEKGNNYTRFELKNRKINAAINDQIFTH